MLIRVEIGPACLALMEKDNAVCAIFQCLFAAAAEMASFSADKIVDFYEPRRNAIVFSGFSGRHES